MSDFANAFEPEELPLPLGVVERTGSILPAFDYRALSLIEPTYNEILQRGSLTGTDFLAVEDVDPNRLSEAGWGVIFCEGSDPAVRSALEPLLELRRSQVRDQHLFKIFDGGNGYRHSDDVRSWLSRSNVGFAVVDPALGVPLHLTLVGSPQQIPFEFQYMLDTYWSVGRLCFDRPEHYRRYAENVLAYETTSTPPHGKHAVVFAPKIDGDRATGLLHDLLALPLVHGTSTSKPLGARQGFDVYSLLGEAATKQNLRAVLGGKAPGGPPALLFSGSHGLFVEPQNESQQERMGAILCQDWNGGPVTPDMIFGAADIPGDARIIGLIHFLFACYGGGCPEFDNYAIGTDGKPRRIAGKSFVAALPREMLLFGALAVIAHIDRAWAYSFTTARCAPQVQEFRDVMTRVLKGDRIGQALDQFNIRWAVLSSELADAEKERRLFPESSSEASLANRWVARNDARNYVLFGDPAVRLRVDEMAESLLPRDQAR